MCKALRGGLLLDSGFCLALPHKALIYPTCKDLVDKSLCRGSSLTFGLPCVEMMGLTPLC